MCVGIMFPSYLFILSKDNIASLFFLFAGAFKIIPVLDVFLSDSQARHLPNDVAS